MDRIYEVKLSHAYDHGVYFVKAGNVGTAATLALQADANTPSGQALKNEPGQTARVISVTEFCSVAQFVG